MIFNKHSNLEGKHAFLGASKYSWVNYDIEHLLNSYSNSLRSEIGTGLHEFAAWKIKHAQKIGKNKKHLIEQIQLYLSAKGYSDKLIYSVATLPDEVFLTITEFVNDGIGFRMEPEQILFYSDNCFGTSDAISFRDGILRVHDLKTGEGPTHIEQLQIYAALFCLEYHTKPSEIEMELRIYQNNDILYYKPTVEEIVPIMDKIVQFDKALTNFNQTE